MGSKVIFAEVLKANVPEGTRDALRVVAASKGQKPASLLRSAILELVRQGGAAGEKAAT
jgi:hypothetical protein